MAAGVPAGALLQTDGMVRAANQNPAAADLLEMALHAEVGIPRREQFGIYGTVRSVAHGAAFVHGFVFENFRAALRRMARETTFILRQHRSSAAFVDRTLVWRVAIRAGHSAFGNWVMIRQAELAAHIRVTLETNFLGGEGGG